MSVPCLPLCLLEQLRNDSAVNASLSFVFIPRFEKFRLSVVKTHGGTVDQPVDVVGLAAPIATLGAAGLSLNGTVNTPNTSLLNNLDNFSNNTRTFLHLSAREADLPLAYEMIRMGVNLDVKDKIGFTALFLVIGNILVFSQILRTPGITTSALSQHSPALHPENISKRIEILVRIATLIIEQHADIDAGAFGYTPASLAAEAGQWALVTLLFRHGAAKPRIQDVKFNSPDDKKHFLSLVDAPVALPRPERPCPCWSGLSFNRCHNSVQPLPYPDDFLCNCGKNKKYGMCCGARGIRVVEKWDQRKNRIMASTTRVVNLPRGVNLDGLGAQLQALQAIQNMGMNHKQLMDLFTANKIPMIREMLQASGREGDVDPAYMYALNTPNVAFPRPWEKQISLVEARKRMNEWNEAVDKYIATQGDPRPPFEIALQAKIGIHGGPLYRHCEAEGCSKVEDRDVDKMKGCGKCKLVFYCGQPCQVRAWKDGHKVECTAGTHRPQQLRSQLVIETMTMLG